MTVLVPPPPRISLVDRNGNITRPWSLYLQDVFTRIGGATAPSNSKLALLAAASNGMAWMGESEDGEDWGVPGPVGPAGPPGSGSTWTEVEIDFGPLPVYDATFTITDAAITSSAVKVVLAPCGKAATGRTADDWQWDGGTFVADPGSGSATCYATFYPGPIVGPRKLQYQVA